MEQRLTIKDAARLVGVCEETLRRAYLSGHLKVDPIGTRNIRVRPSELQKWLEAGGLTRAAA